MKITTPAEITSVAWEGELIEPALTLGPPPSDRPIVTIGQPTIWPAAEALESELGRKWVPPLGGASYWLVRLACTLRKPGRLKSIAEARQTLSLKPRNRSMADRATYAHSLYPDRLAAEDSSEFNVSLGPELKFGSGIGIKVGEVGTTIGYRKVYPVIQSYGVGESMPEWIFKPHAAHPLEGSQFVYAVVAAKPGAGGILAKVDLVVTAEVPFGFARFGLSEEAQEHTKFIIL